MTNRTRVPASPTIARSVLGFLLTREDRESVVTELDELYAMRCERQSVGRARSWYRRQVMHFAVQLLRHGRRRCRRSPLHLASGFASGGGAYHRYRKGVGVTMWNHVSELRQSFRRLLRAPVFMVVSVLTIGIGIGAFTAIFGLAEAVLLEPMPYRQPDDLVWVWRNYSWANFPRGWLAGPDIIGLREQTDVVESVVVVQSGQLNLTGPQMGAPQRVDVIIASHELFDLLGVSPILGRGFTPEEDVPNTNRVAVLGFDYWQRQYDGDPDILGQTMFLNGQSTTIIGVAPEPFHFVRHSSLGEPTGGDLYLNLPLDIAETSPFNGSYAGLVRLRPDVRPDQLQAALAAAAETSDLAFDNRGLRLWATNLKEDLTAGVRPALAALVGSATFLLLILTANLATLLIGRAAVREHELGVRSALGAGRGRILSSVLSESLILGALGGGLGIVLGFFGTNIVLSLAPENLPRLQEVGLDSSVLAVSVFVSLGMTLAAGLTPAFQALRGNLPAAIKEGGARSGGSIRGARTRNALVVAQVALSLMLLVGAGLVAQAFAGLLREDPGFDPGTTLTFSVPLAASTYPDRASVQGFHRQFRERLASLPGVTAVGSANALPLTMATNQTGVRFPGAEGNTGDDNIDGPLIDWYRVGDGYFTAAGLRLLAGRWFESSDQPTGDERPAVAIIDDVLAQQFFPNGPPVGRQAVFRGDTLTIVGVVDHARFYNVHSDDRGQVYIPDLTRGMAYALRTGLDPTVLVGGARLALRQLDPEVPMSDVRTLDAIVKDSLGQQRLSLTLIGGFAVGALLLAVLGLYGVVANNVVRRTQEMGVRMALGADAARVLRLVLGQGLRLAGIGAAVGLVGAIATSRFLEGVMVGIDANNPVIYVVVAASLVAVAAAASYLPAWRATRIDPVEALRPE
ncbi:MAG: ABC transporter permease [Gemmatimonadetes bacterium]|nr:ABC transporter permease [Gemmatimonadota bacterium]